MKKSRGEQILPKFFKLKLKSFLVGYLNVSAPTSTYARLYICVRKLNVSNSSVHVKELHATVLDILPTF